MPADHTCTTSAQHADHRALLGRLSRIEGQVRGLARMIEGDRYCLDILTQISAAKSALTSVEREVLKAHADHCVSNAISSGNKEEQDQKMSELVALLFKAVR